MAGHSRCDETFLAVAASSDATMMVASELSASRPPIEWDRSALSGSKLGYGVRAQFIGSKSQAFL
jgi:hypothetical protein